MSSHRKRKDYYVVMQNGNLNVYGPNIEGAYKYPIWLLKLNPKFVLPGLRRDYKRIIYVNGKKYGSAEYRQGCVPLHQFKIKGKGFSVWLRNFIRQTFGLGCNMRERGYFLVKLKGHIYIVLRHYTKAGNLFCQIYYQPTNELMGTFTFDKEFENVYPSFRYNDWFYSMFVIIGYMADVTIYSAVAQQLNREITIKF